jgi:hypothetical protein
MIQYRLLECVKREGSAVLATPFGVAFRDRRGVFLFVPEWRSPQRLAVTDLHKLQDRHLPQTIYELRWADAVHEWQEGSDEDFRPLAVFFPRAAVRSPSGGLTIKPSHFPSDHRELTDLILGYAPLPIPWSGTQAKTCFQSGVASAHPQLFYAFQHHNKYFFCEELAWLATRVVVPTLDNGPRVAVNSINELLGRAGLYPRKHNLVLERLLDDFYRLTQPEQPSSARLAKFLQTNWTGTG